MEIEDRAEAYRIYMSDMLRVAAMDIRNRDGLPRFYDLTHPQEVKDVDPEEIIERIMKGVNQS